MWNSYQIIFSWPYFYTFYLIFTNILRRHNVETVINNRKYVVGFRPKKKWQPQARIMIIGVWSAYCNKLPEKCMQLEVYFGTVIMTIYLHSGEVCFHMLSIDWAADGILITIRKSLKIGCSRYPIWKVPGIRK